MPRLCWAWIETLLAACQTVQGFVTPVRRKPQMPLVTWATSRENISQQVHKWVGLHCVHVFIEKWQIWLAVVRWSTPWGCQPSGNFTKCSEWIPFPPRCPRNLGVRRPLITQVRPASLAVTFKQFTITTVKKTKRKNLYILFVLFSSFLQYKSHQARHTLHLWKGPLRKKKEQMTKAPTRKRKSCKRNVSFTYLLSNLFSEFQNKMPLLHENRWLKASINI